MCHIIVINKGEKEIETPRQFLEHFGFEGIKESYYKDVDIDACLCQIDIEKTFKQHEIKYKVDCMEYYVGKLNEIHF